MTSHLLNISDLDVQMQQETFTVRAETLTSVKQERAVQGHHPRAPTGSPRPIATYT